MSEKHGIRWQDEQMAGVDCRVKMVPNPRHVPGLTAALLPGYGGVASAGERHTCEACGATLMLKWDVQLVEVATDA